MQATVSILIKWIALVVMGVVSVLAIALAFLSWQSGVEFEKKIVAIRDAGLPATLADLATERMPSQLNAVTYIRRVQSDAIAIEEELRSIGDKLSENAVLTEEELTKIAETFSAYPNLLPLIEQAADCKEYRSDLDFSKLPGGFLEEGIAKVNGPRNIARVLHKYNALQISRGKFDEAAKYGLVLVRIARHAENEPTLMSFLSAVAVRGIALASLSETLQSGIVSPEMRRSIEAELAIDEQKNAFAKALISERAFGNSYFEDLPWTMKKLNRNQFLDYMQDRISNADAPYSVFMKPSRKGFGLLPLSSIDMVQPAINSSFEAWTRNRAISRAIRVLNAIQGSDALVHSENIDVATLPLPPEAKIDPFTSNPLTVKKLEKGWLVYSFGRNLKDDGGEVALHQDEGTKP